VLLTAKILVTFSTVLLLSWIASRSGPKLAGLMSGFPLGSAISLYFIGMEQGADFAAIASIHSLGGLTSSLCLAGAYWWTMTRFPSVKYLPLVLVVSLGAFIVSAWVLQFLPSEREVNLAAVVAAIILFRLWFKQIPAASIVKPRQGVWLKPWFTLLFRAAVATAAVLLVTGLASLLSPTQAGLLAAFPISFFPLMLILHISFGAPMLASTIRHYPDGMGALVIYLLTIGYTYSTVGVALGTAIGLLCSILYLATYALFSRHLQRKG